MPTPTTDLVEALNRFDPLHPLQTDDELRDFFVAREHSPLEPLIAYLKNRKQPAKLLFMGSRGSGKSTELTKMASRLRDQFTIVSFHAGEMLDINDLEPVDVVLGCALALLGTASVNPNMVHEELWRDVEAWMRKEVLTEQVIVDRGARPSEFGVSLKLLVGEIAAKWNAESVTRRTIRPRLQTMLSELVGQMNRVIPHVQHTLARPPLVLIEDLDKTGLAQARRLFFEEGRLLRLLNCHIVYTFPIALRYSNDYAQIRQSFEMDFKLPNISIHHPNGSPDKAGRAMLKDLVLRRADPSLFQPEALERAVECSGGLVVDLIRLAQGAVLRALVANTAAVTPQMVNEVVAEIRNDFRAALRADHYQALRDAAVRHEVMNETAVQESLHNQSLLEYRNAESWCDVHPIVQPLLNPPSP